VDCDAAFLGWGRNAVENLLPSHERVSDFVGARSVEVHEWYADW
jgi:hypothetical protein